MHRHRLLQTVLTYIGSIFISPLAAMEANNIPYDESCRNLIRIREVPFWESLTKVVSRNESMLAAPSGNSSDLNTFCSSMAATGGLVPLRQDAWGERQWETLSLKEKLEKDPQRFLQSCVCGNVLHLSNFKLGGDEMSSLGSHILSHASHITWLHLEGNEISQREMIALKGLLINLPHLTALSLGWNPLKDEGIKILGSFLPDMHALMFLELSHTQVTDDGIKALIPNLRGIYEVNLSGNVYGKSVSEAFKQANFFNTVSLNKDLWEKSLI